MSLFDQRPGAQMFSWDFLDFATARYVRLRLQGMHQTMGFAENSVLGDQHGGGGGAGSLVDKQSFYSLRHIRIAAMAECSGHASKTRHTMDQVS